MPSIDGATNNQQASSSNATPSPVDLWQQNLIRDNRGLIRPVLANAITALRQCPAWKGQLGFNEFLDAPVCLKTLAEWCDNDDLLTAERLQRHGIYVSKEIAAQAVQVVARDCQFHPVRDYLTRLTWDGTPRIDSWLTEYLGAAQTDYASAVGRRWLISAVARIYRPGCKADCCLILEGPQGTGKSTVLRALAEPWYTDEIAELGTKDAALQTRGVWIIELSELDAMTKAEIAKVKAFMSRATDRFRPPYGHRLIESPRQCVFAGSVNHSDYLRDETGGRRFWPVACGKIDIEVLARERDHLWAEAVVRFRTGDPWWLETPDLNSQAGEEQFERFQQDPWHEEVIKWAEGMRAQGCDVSVSEILQGCLQITVDRWDQKAENRVARCLKAGGFERYKKRNGKAFEWRYRRA
jgi:predicted P-loop ATPase